MKMKRKRKRNSSADPASGNNDEPPVAEFEVLLNFRGLDTHLSFTNCLYHSMDGAGVRVFRDEEEIRKGEEIGGKLLRAIDNSKVYAPIFSRDYASSAWCLRKLAHIVESSRGSNGKVILPIFYDVDAYDVKLRTGLYDEALKKHEDRFGCNEVQWWKEALMEVARIKGWDLKGKGYSLQIGHFAVDQHTKRKIFGNRSRIKRSIYIDTTGKVQLSNILLMRTRLKKRQSNLPHHLVGIHDHLEDMMSLLQEGSLDMRFVVIHGMGGVGKTTLAEAVFNRISHQFSGHSFLSNVHESSQDDQIRKLQWRLLSDIRKFQPKRIYDTNDGISMIKERFRHKKVLIVLDDIDNRNQLVKLAGEHDWFGPGSRIIITTRDIGFLSIKKGRLRDSDSIHHEEFYIYKMKEMPLNHALELFSKHAFRRDTPPHGHANIATKIVKTTGGLPLALKVIGSSLCYKSKAVWEDMLEKLMKMPHREVHDILVIRELVHDILDGLGQLENLRELQVTWCKFPEKISGLLRLTRLRDFKVISCHWLVEIQGLDQSKSLEHIYFHQCDSIRELPDLLNLQKLGTLEISQRGLGSLPAVANNEICYLKVYKCRMLCNFRGTYQLYLNQRYVDPWSHASTTQ